MGVINSVYHLAFSLNAAKDYSAGDLGSGFLLVKTLRLSIR
jgi:hypothetical protein